MNDLQQPAEGWITEVVLAMLIGVPWYFFSSDLTLSVSVHIGLAVLFLTLELLILGRGGVIVAFLFVLVLSLLIGILLVGAYGGRLAN